MRTHCLGISLCLMLVRVGLSAATVLPDFAGDSLVLAKAGRPAATIVVSQEAGENETQAAQELQYYLQRMSGAQLPIVTDEAEVRGPVLSVGRNRYQRQAGVMVQQGQYPLSETVRIALRDSTLVVLGNDGPGGYRGTLFAVYTLLEGLGCRWYMPGDLGECIPQRPTVGVRAIDYEYSPTYLYRQPFWVGYVSQDRGIPDWMRDEQYAWLARNKQGGVPIASGHNFFRLVPPALFDQHPDYFALVEGERTPEGQICTSNAEVIKRSVDLIISHFDHYPESISYSLSPNDGAGWCECDECAEVSDHLMDRLLTFFNAVAEGVAKKHPDKILAFYVYADLTLLPDKVTPHPMVFPVIAHYNNADQFHPMTADLSTARFYREIIEGWRGLSGRIGIREYFGYGFDEFPKPIVHTLRGSIPYWTRNGAIFCNSEGGDGWGGSGLSWYIAAKLLWDPALDIDRLLDDYFTGMFAEAADPMSRYFMTLEEAAAAAGGPVVLGPYQIPSIFNPVMSDLETHLAEAEKAATKDTTKRRVAFVRSHFTYAQKYLAARNAHDAFLVSATNKTFSAAEGAAEDLADYARGLGKGYVINLNYFEGQVAEGALKQMAASRADLRATLGKYDLVTTLPELWRFCTDTAGEGEQDGWFRTEFDDSDWQALSTQRFWETQIGPYDGVGWYRLRITLPDMPAGKRVFIRFGAIDESEWIWVNGQAVGSFVFDAEKNPSSWKEPISFEITKAVHRGQENVIAVRVQDLSGLGGIWKGASIVAEK